MMLQIAAFLSVVVAVTGFASTPIQAARQFLVRKGGTITHVSESATFAVATFTNGRIEGTREGGQLLLRHFSFGWQATDGAFGAAFPRCRLLNAGVPASIASALSWHGSLKVEQASDCHGKYADSGSAYDISAVRAKMAETHNEFLIGPVRISHDYALADWSIPGGGQTLLKRTLGGWTIVTSGGGALSPADLTGTYHVPAADARVLIPQRSQ